MPHKLSSPVISTATGKLDLAVANAASNDVSILSVNSNGMPQRRRRR